MADLLNPKIKSFRLHKGKTSIKQIGLVLAIALFFTGLVWLAGWAVKREIENWEKKTITRLADLAAAKRDTVKIPAAFLQDMPFIDANLIELYTRDAKTEDITAIIRSTQSVKDAFAYYVNYGKRNGWQIAEAKELKDNAPAKLLLQKNSFILSLAIEQKDNGSKITISSTLINSEILNNLDIKSLKLK